MDLQCLAELALAYKAGPQIARVVSEAWCAREMYCPACDSNRITQSATNTPAIDFTCPRCGQAFQLKSMKKWNPRKVPDAGYEAMVNAIRADRTPNLLVLHYSNNWAVENLLLIPRAFFTESVIEKRKPLSSKAQRAGWVGCNILLSEIPKDGKIEMVSAGCALPDQRVRDEFSRVRRLAELPPSLRGWTVDVLGGIRRLGKERLSLQEIYALEPEMKALHPNNKNVRPKIRQQLQVLRDVGLIEFVRPGHYILKTGPRQQD
jgi:type II restriction enzyme